MTYYLVKLKPDCRWLDDAGSWVTNRAMADRFGTRLAANEHAHSANRVWYNTGDIVVVRVRTVKRKVIPVPTVTLTGSKNGKEISINGYPIDDYAETETLFLQIRRALGIPEST